MKCPKCGKSFKYSFHGLCEECISGELERIKPQEYPVLPQQILKLNWDEGNVRTGMQLDIKTLQLKIDEIINVVNDMRKKCL